MSLLSKLHLSPFPCTKEFTKISQRRQKHKQRDGNEVVQRIAQVVSKAWDDAASMDVFNLEDERNEFKVVDTRGVRSAASNETPSDTRACMLVLTSENGLKTTYSMSYRAKSTITTRTVQCMGYSQETLYLL
jgi:hypothetical protein